MTDLTPIFAGLNPTHNALIADMAIDHRANAMQAILDGQRDVVRMFEAHGDDDYSLDGPAFEAAKMVKAALKKAGISPVVLGWLVT